VTCPCGFALRELRQSWRRDIAIPPALLSAILKLLPEPIGGVAAPQWAPGTLTPIGIASHHRSPLPKESWARSKLLFVAEHEELATLRGRGVTPEAWWRDGAIRPSRDEVAEVLASLQQEWIEGPVA
jgi:hypothetical protein